MSNEIRSQLEATVKRIVAELDGSDTDWWKEWLEYNPDEGYTLDDTPLPSAYLEDALDIEITTNFRGDYLGARICVGLGGPNVYINTRYSRVEAYWGSDEFSWSYTDNIGLDDYVEEVWKDVR